MRFGIGMNTDHTLEEVGQQFSVTRERIRQIEAKALRKLKHRAAAARCAASSINKSGVGNPIRARLLATGHRYRAFRDQVREGFARSAL